MMSAPTLISATFVPKSLPEAESNNIEYGNPNALTGSVASRIPMPGTITTSCLRTQTAILYASMPFPTILNASAGALEKR